MICQMLAMHSWRAMIGIVAVLAVLAVPVTPMGAAPVQALTYAPIDRPGPPLSVPVEVLEQSLSCSGDLAAGPVPVLLVPGTWAVPREHYGWNYMRAFAALGWPYCAVTTPKYAMEDMQISGEYVVHAIRTLYQWTGRRIAILGGSPTPTRTSSRPRPPTTPAPLRSTVAGVASSTSLSRTSVLSTSPITSKR